MKRMFDKKLASLALVLLVPATSWAAGFGVSEFDSRTSGRAYSGIAMKDTPAMVYWNPANITQLEGLQLSANMSAIALQYKYESLDGSQSQNSDTTLTPPPALFISYKLGDKAFHDLSIGAGVMVPFGSTVRWPDNWIGNQQLQELGLTVFETRLVGAFTLFDKIGIGAALRVIPAGVYLKRAVGFGSTATGGVELAGEDTGMGWGGSISYYATDKLTFAFNYRSAVDLTFEGASNFDFPPPFDTAGNDMDVKADLTLPHSFILGASWEVIPEHLTLSLDVNFEMWSSFEDLTIVFIDEDGNETANGELKDSRDVLSVRGGVEYKFNDSFGVRAGYLFDPHIGPEKYLSPAPPDSDTHVVSLGASYYYKWFGVHAHVIAAIMAERTSTTSHFPGVYSGGFGGAKAIIGGLTLSAKFDVAPALVGAETTDTASAATEEAATTEDAATTEEVMATEEAAATEEVTAAPAPESEGE